MFLCSGVELMVELSGDDCPEPVSEEAARMLKLFSIQASFPSVSHNWHFAHILSICQALWSWSLYLMYIAQICICITVCVCVCAKTGEPVELLIGLWTRVGAGNHVLGRSSIPHKKGEFWEGCFLHSNALYQWDLFEQPYVIYIIHTHRKQLTSVIYRCSSLAVTHLHLRNKASSRLDD